MRDSTPKHINDDSGNSVEGSASLNIELFIFLVKDFALLKHSHAGFDEIPNMSYS